MPKDQDPSSILLTVQPNLRSSGNVVVVKGLTVTVTAEEEYSKANNSYHCKY